jgi:hypothetical protein
MLQLLACAFVSVKCLLNINTQAYQGLPDWNTFKNKTICRNFDLVRDERQLFMTEMSITFCERWNSFCFQYWLKTKDAGKDDNNQSYLSASRPFLYSSRYKMQKCNYKREFKLFHTLTPLLAVCNRNSLGLNFETKAEKRGLQTVSDWTSGNPSTRQPANERWKWRHLTSVWIRLAPPMLCQTFCRFL